MNLTAIRDPKVFASLHLVECLLCGQAAPSKMETVLDYGSGAGLPGIPLQIVRPEMAVTLAESQQKKAVFLREAIRELQLAGTQVYQGRVEEMTSDRLFDLVTLRAVDKMAQAVAAAWQRVRPGGMCMVLASQQKIVSSVLQGAEWLEPIAVPGTEQRVILRASRAF